MVAAASASYWAAPHNAIRVRRCSAHALRLTTRCPPQSTYAPCPSLFHHQLEGRKLFCPKINPAYREWPTSPFWPLPLPADHEDGAGRRAFTRLRSHPQFEAAEKDANKDIARCRDWINGTFVARKRPGTAAEVGAWEEPLAPISSLLFHIFLVAQCLVNLTRSGLLPAAYKKLTTPMALLRRREELVFLLARKARGETRNLISALLWSVANLLTRCLPRRRRCWTTAASVRTPPPGAPCWRRSCASARRRRRISCVPPPLLAVPPASLPPSPLIPLPDLRRGVAGHGPSAAEAAASAGGPD